MTARPTVAEADAAPPNGMNAASLFAGCGGSSLGYRAAGFRVVYANEFAAPPREAYALNASAEDPPTLDGRDVKKVTGADILTAAGGALDVLDASPPCTPFSMAGARGLRGDPHDMFPEFLRLVGEVQPRAFVAENVGALVQGRRAATYAAELMGGLREKGYRVAARVLHAERFGVPQARRRLIMLGFREDQGEDPADWWPQDGPRRAVIRDAIPDAVRLVRRQRAGRAGNVLFNAEQTRSADEPSWTITASGVSASSQEFFVEVPARGSRTEHRPMTWQDAARLCGFPDDFDFGAEHSVRAVWRMVGNAVPPPLSFAWAQRVRDALLAAPR